MDQYHVSQMAKLITKKFFMNIPEMQEQVQGCLKDYWSDKVADVRDINDIMETAEIYRYSRDSVFTEDMAKTVLEFMREHHDGDQAFSDDFIGKSIDLVWEVFDNRNKTRS